MAAKGRTQALRQVSTKAGLTQKGASRRRELDSAGKLLPERHSRSAKSKRLASKLGERSVTAQLRGLTPTSERRSLRRNPLDLRSRRRTRPRQKSTHHLRSRSTPDGCSMRV